MTPDNLLMAFSLGACAALPMGIAIGYYLRPKPKPAQIVMLADGRVSVDTGYQDIERDIGYND